MTLAILCSGQGPQHPRMFALTGDAPDASSVFEHAATLLGGRDPREIVRSDADLALHGNRVGQILCATQATAANAALRGAWPGRRVIAGYSVGEVAAWGMAGLLDSNAILDLVERRAAAMDAHSRPGDGLLFVRGLPRETIERLCRRHDSAIAIVNPADAFVVGGAGSALDALADDAKRLGATRVVQLAVEVASHTPRLAAATAEFREFLGRAPIRSAPEAGVRLLSGIDGLPVVDIAEGMNKLADQISRTVAWSDCLQGCVEAGVSAFLELGPGKALSEMAASACPGIPARSLEEFRTLQGARDWLKRLER